MALQESCTDKQKRDDAYQLSQFDVQWPAGPRRSGTPLSSLSRFHGLGSELQGVL